MRYRRAFVPGASYFFTVVTANRRPLFAEARNVDVLREAFRSVRAKRPFAIEAMVVMPDHLHCIWRLPPGDADFATRWRLIKSHVTRHLGSTFQNVWQNRYWEHLLRDEENLNRHLDYIHYNPVKHGLVGRAGDWPYSSYRYVVAGFYPNDWGQGDGPDLAGVGSE